MSEEIERRLKVLSAGLVQNSVQKIYEAHRALYKVGHEVLPFAEQIILKQPWTEIRHVSRLVLFTGLFNLIQDIDEKRDYLQKLKRRNDELETALELLLNDQQ